MHYVNFNKGFSDVKLGQFVECSLKNIELANNVIFHLSKLLKDINVFFLLIQLLIAEVQEKRTQPFLVDGCGMKNRFLPILLHVTFLQVCMMVCSLQKLKSIMKSNAARVFFCKCGYG